MKINNLISFIIPHKGRFEMLKQTLLSINEQAYPMDQIEVIIVSQTPEIEQIELLENCKFNLKVMLLSASKTISAQRNYGVEQSSGEYLAFLDADIFISSNWISCMLSHLRAEKKNVIVSAMQICDASAPPLEQIRTNLSNAELDTNVAFLPGRNLFLSKDSFEKVKGFPEHLITCEDYYFTDKVAQFGKLYYTSDANYIHLGEDKVFSEMFKKEIWRGQSNLQSIKGRRIPLREIPSFILPLGITTSILIVLISLLFHAYSMTLVFSIFSVGPILVYSIRLHRLSKAKINFSSIFRFYLTYFLARAIGTLAGLFKSIGANHH